MPRKRRTDKRRFEMTLDVINLLVQFTRAAWEEFWGGEGEAAFSALRWDPRLGSQDDDSYEDWCERLEAKTAALWDDDPREVA